MNPNRHLHLASEDDGALSFSFLLLLLLLLSITRREIGDGERRGGEAVTHLALAYCFSLCLGKSGPHFCKRLALASGYLLAVYYFVPHNSVLGRYLCSFVQRLVSSFGPSSRKPFRLWYGIRTGVEIYLSYTPSHHLYLMF